ncbi:MAG: 50S ribosomal protein L13 [Candidatus Aenigmarchaeota archaeon]|nr:50S ribosomal protein L13 [Candidatus Aenigmarchaeota archaeon]
MKFYDAENQILGRLASVVAKELLNGERIIVVNSEKAVLSGNPKSKVEFYFHRLERGDAIHGPFFPKYPNEILRRTVRGMLPWDRTKGRSAFKNLKVFVGVPEEFKDRTFEKISIADASKLKNKYITLGEISNSIGGMK